MRLTLDEAKLLAMPRRREPRTSATVRLLCVIIIAFAGSRAAIVESNAKPLDDLATYSDPVLIEFIAKEKAKLAGTIEDEHRMQYWMDRERDERFE